MIDFVIVELPQSQLLLHSMVNDTIPNRSVGASEVQEVEPLQKKQQQGSHGPGAAKAPGKGLPAVPPKLAFALMGDKQLREKLKALSLPTIGKRPVRLSQLSQHSITANLSEICLAIFPRKFGGLQQAWPRRA